MEDVLFKPEGMLIGSFENKDYTSSLNMLCKAKNANKTLEARAVMCDSHHNLSVELGGIRAIIPREEAAIGINDGSVRDIAIISRVNKPVCFKILKIDKDDGVILSRRAAQEECKANLLCTLKRGDIVDAVITHLEPFGAFADIGCGIVALITIDNISVSRISHPSDRFVSGQKIKAVIKDIDYNLGRFNLSHKELLGTWEENASKISAGQTVAGAIRSIENYGIFVELAPNLAGLAEYRDGLHIGQSAAVYIKSIIPEKMKVKLSIIDAFNNDFAPKNPEYFISGNNMNRWIYSPPQCPKIIETVFD